MTNVRDAASDTFTFHIFILYQPPDLTRNHESLIFLWEKNLFFKKQNKTKTMGSPKSIQIWVPFAYLFIQNVSRFMLKTLPISYLTPCKRKPAHSHTYVNWLGSFLFLFSLLSCFLVNTWFPFYFLHNIPIGIIPSNGQGSVGLPVCLQRELVKASTFLCHRAPGRTTCLPLSTSLM